MDVTLLHDFHPGDTGLFNRSVFTMKGGDAELKVFFDEQGDVSIVFKGIRWHEFTSLYDCSVEQISSAYFKLVELNGSERLISYEAADSAKSPLRAYAILHHYRVFLDELR